MPVLAGVMQRQALPSGVFEVIKIAARCPEASHQAEGLTGVKAEVIRQAAELYLQSVLFAPSADSYRVLGVTPDAPQDEIRRHMRWLMKWLHPDRERGEWESAFAERVLTAWEELKSLERRAQYERNRPPRRANAPMRAPRARQRRPQIPWISGFSPIGPVPSSPWRRLLAAIGVGAMARRFSRHRAETGVKPRRGVPSSPRRGSTDRQPT
jgi:hypothetical protein